MGKIKNWYYHQKSKDLLFYGFLIIYTAVLTYLCKAVPFWEDEFYTLNTTSRNVTGVISQSYNFEGQPPLFFVLLKFWRQLNDGYPFARLLSIIFIGLAAFFFTKLLRLVSGNRGVRLLLIIFLLNPFTVWAALETRTYAMLIFLSTISIYFFLSYFFNNKNSHLYLFLIFCTLGLYTQYYFVFLIIGLAFSIWIIKGFKVFFRLCLYLIPVVLLFLPNLYFLREHLTQQETSNSNYSVLDSLSKVLQSPPKMMLALNLVPSKNAIKLIIIILFILLAAFTYLKAYKQPVQSDLNFEMYNVILISAVVIVIIFSIVVVLTRVVYADRYMSIAYPCFIILFTLFLVYSSQFKNLIFGILTISFISLLFITYVHPMKFYDFKYVTKYIKKIERSGEPILFYRNVMSLPFSYSYKGHNQLVPLPTPVRFDSTYLKNIRDTTELKLVIGTIKTKSDSYLLVSDDIADFAYSVNFNRKMIDNYLRTHYNITLDTLCYGEGPDFFLRIRRLETKLLQ